MSLLKHYADSGHKRKACDCGWGGLYFPHRRGCAGCYHEPPF